MVQLSNLPHGARAKQTSISTDGANFNVSLDLVSVKVASLTNAQKGLTIQSLVHNNTLYAISIRSGCIGPLVRLSVQGDAVVFKPKFYAANADQCIPTMVNIPAQSARSLSNRYLLQDAKSNQRIPTGTYRAEEELTYTVVSGDPARRYKKSSDHSQFDTFTTTRVRSNALLLTINSTSTGITSAMSPLTSAQASLIQSSAGNSGSANPNRAFTRNVQAGNLLVAAINCANHSLGLPKDSLGNVWMASATQISGQNFTYSQGMYYAVTAKSGKEKITFTCNTRSSFAIVEFAGLENTPFDRSGAATGTSATPGVTTSYPGTTQAFDLIIGFVGDNLTAKHAYMVTSSGYSEIQRNSSTRGNIELAYTTTAAQGNFTTSWQVSTTTAWGALQAAFKIAPPPLTYPQNSSNGPFSPKIVVIDYNTTGLADDGSSSLTQRLMQDWTTGSSYHGGSLSSVNFQVYATYVENNPPPILPGTSQGTGTGDYQAIFNKYNICNLAATQGVNFVWIWAEGEGGTNYSADFDEWVATGPTFYQTYGTNVPFCGSNTIVTNGFNYGRSVAEALHSMGHYMENLLQFTFGPSTDLASGVPGGTDMYDLFDGQASRYGGYTGPLNVQTASCGDVHYPPNAVNGYDYGNNDVVWSNCSDYNPGNPSAALYWEVSAGSWQGIPCDPSLGFGSEDCNQESYLMWWMQNMPGYNNGVLDLYQYNMPNWWQYIVALDTTIRYN